MDEEQITITMPMTTFQLAIEFIAQLGSALDGAESKIKADMKGAKAAEKMKGLGLGAEAPGLEGFGQELSGLSDSRLGM
jgi:hypothetical protein